MDGRDDEDDGVQLDIDVNLLQQFIADVEEYAIFLLDRDGHVASWNEGAERIKGYSEQEILGAHFSVFYPDDTDANPDDVLEVAIDDGQYQEVGWRVRKDGTKIWARVTVRSLFDETGTLRGFSKIVRDRSREKRRRSERRRNLDHLARSEALADMGGWELDVETDTLRWTDGTRRLHEVGAEYEPNLEDAIGFYHPDDRDAVANAVDHCRSTGEPFDIEVRIITANGRERWVQTRGEFVTDSASKKLRGVIRDISDRKEREQRLMVLNRVLRHNLRNNLNVVTGYAKALEQDLESLELPPEIRDCDGVSNLLDTVTTLSRTADDIHDDLRALEQLVDNVATFSAENARSKTRRIVENSQNLVSLAEKARLSEQAIEHDGSVGPTALRPIIEELRSKYATEYPAATIEVDAVEATVPGQSEAVRLAIGELLENAVKHDDSESPRATVTVTKPSAERVEVSIADTGPGIPDMEQDVLRHEAESALMHGSGMGLWTVNWILTRLGGSIEIEANDPRGTIVTLTLPTASTDAP
ncbi:MAG: PAS domain-containing sensor histidine kinase [Halobacteriota archaeon]